MWAEIVKGISEGAVAIGGISVIGTFIVKSLRFMKKQNEELEKKEQWRNKKDRNDEENYKAILRLTVSSSEMPLYERIKAGEKYIEMGGNGHIKALYTELLDKYQKINKDIQEGKL